MAEEAVKEKQSTGHHNQLGRVLARCKFLSF
jgi:hypothetical protein